MTALLARAPGSPATRPNDSAGVHSRFVPRFYHHLWHHLVNLRRGIERSLQQHGLPKAGDKVVDLGCGDRPYAPLFKDCDYVGCDIDGDADVKITPGQPVPLPDGCADGVVSFQVLEHVADLDWYLGECRRLLKPGGWLLLSTHGVWLYHPHPTDFRRWTRDGLVTDLEQRGLRVASVNPVVGPLAWTTQFRLLGYREVLRRVPGLGAFLLAPVAAFMNLRMVIEDSITPESIRSTNASVYVTLSHKPSERIV
jgi:SAM-dependent methyltransferase